MMEIGKWEQKREDFERPPPKKKEQITNEKLWILVQKKLDMEGIFTIRFRGLFADP